MFDFNDDLNIWGTKKPKPKSKSTKRGTIYSYWKDEILTKQKNKCAGKTCAKDHNGKKVNINTRSHFDHIKPLKLGGKNELKNLQALCANCHMKKTRKDRFDMSKSQKNISSSSDGYVTAIGTISGVKKKMKKSQTRKMANIITGKMEYYYNG